MKSRDPLQWAQVRTKAFKKWFGDWEKTARIAKRRKSQIVNLTGYKGQYELNPKSAREWIKNNLEGKSYEILDTGESVRIGRVG